MIADEDPSEVRPPSDTSGSSTRHRSLARNTLQSGLSSASNMLLVVLVVVAARVLGDVDYGVFCLGLSAATIAELLIDFGVGQLVAREVARDRSLTSGYLRSIMGWKLLLSGAAVLVLAAGLHLIHTEGRALVACYILGGAAVLRSHKYTATALFQAYERFDLIVLTSYTERISVLLGGILALLIWHSLIAFCLAFVLSRIPDMLISFWLLHTRISPIKVGFDRSTIRTVQAAALPFGVYSFVVTGYANISTIVLSAVSTPEQVGLYNAGGRIYEGMQMFPYLVGAAMLPRLSRLFIEDADQHRSIGTQGMRYVMIVTLPIAAFIAIAAPQLVTKVFGADFAGGIPALRVLLAASVAMVANGIMRTVLVSVNGEKLMLRISVISMAILAAASLALGQSYGATGAAYAVLIGEVCAALLFGIAVHKPLSPIAHCVFPWKPITACTAGIGLVCAFDFGLPIVEACAFGAAYTAVIFALRTFTSDEIALAKGLLSSLNPLSR